MYKVGIVGVSRGKRFVSSFEAHPDMKVTALCDLDSPLLAEVGAAFELPDDLLFEDYDAFLGADMSIVMIATPIPLHTEQTGLHSGFHRFPERADKPGFLDMEVGLFQTAKGSVIKILRSQTPVRPHMVWYALYGTKGSVENGRLGDGGVLYIKDEMGGEGKAETPGYSTVDPAAPPEARRGGHGTSEYFMIRDFLKAVATNSRPSIDIVKSIEMTVPGLVAHESAMRGGLWLDVPQYEW